MEGSYVDTILVPKGATIPYNGFVFSDPITISFKEGLCQYWRKKNSKYLLSINSLGINLIYVIPTSGYAYSMQTFRFALN